MSPVTVPILIVFHSSEGQTATIAHRIAHRLEEKGASPTVRSVDDAPPPDGFDAVVLGDSIHVGRHSREMIEYARRNSERLSAGISGVFQVSLTSASADEESVEMASTMMDDFCRAAKLEPDRIGLFAGALAFSRYRGIERFLMQHVAREGGLDPDPTRDHSYTDWNAVDSFADAILRLARRTAVARADGLDGLVDWEPSTVDPQSPLRAVVEAMSGSSASAILVQSSDVDPLCTESCADVVGIITEHDIVDAVHEGADLDVVWAADVMSRAPVALAASASLDVMATAMAANNIRHLVVVDADRQVGLVSAGALIGAFIDG